MHSFIGFHSIGLYRVFQSLRHFAPSCRKHHNDYLCSEPDLIIARTEKNKQAISTQYLKKVWMWTIVARLGTSISIWCSTLIRLNLRCATTVQRVVSLDRFRTIVLACKYILFMNLGIVLCQDCKLFAWTTRLRVLCASEDADAVLKNLWPFHHRDEDSWVSSTYPDFWYERFPHVETYYFTILFLHKAAEK